MEDTTGKRIMRRRIELQMSQDELAKKIGYKDRSSIARIESDERELRQNTLVKIAQALDCTPAYLMGWDELEQNCAPVFHERLRGAMTAKNISQTELCGATGIPKSAMSQYLSGAFTPKRNRVFLIANALDVSEAWLMGYDAVSLPSPEKASSTEDSRKVFSRNLSALLESSGRSRQEVCTDLGIVYSTFSEWLNARKYPRIDKIEMLADYFGVRKSDLIEEHSDGTVEECARRFCKAVKSSGLSYPELSRLSGVSKSSLQRYATGITKKIPLDSIKSVAKALHVDESWLAGCDEPTPLSVFLSYRRKELGLTMQDVADAVGVSLASISRYESGEIKNMV